MRLFLHSGTYFRETSTDFHIICLATEICQDVKEECGKFGEVLEIKVPRPSGGRQMPGVGKIFVKFDQPESAQAALKALAGRKFADRTVVVTFFGEVRQLYMNSYSSFRRFH